MTVLPVGAIYNQGTLAGSGFVWDGTRDTFWLRGGDGSANGSFFFREDGAYHYRFDVDHYELLDSHDNSITLSNSLTMIPLDPNWIDHGQALAGTHGAPSLYGANALTAGATITLTLKNALESSFSSLIVGFSELGVPFAGGTLVPFPDIVLAMIPTGADGTVTISLAAPTDLPAGLDFYMQHWIVDPVGPLGLAASNAVKTTSL